MAKAISKALAMAFESRFTAQHQPFESACAGRHHSAPQLQADPRVLDSPAARSPIYGSVPALLGASFPGRRGSASMRVAMIERLQRTHGNRATTRLLAQSAPSSARRTLTARNVQPSSAVLRYVETNANAYKNLPDNNPTLIAPNQRPEFSAQEMTIDANTQVVNPLLDPDLKVADNGEMAIAIAPQPKEFYADPAVIDDSNKKLEGVDSPLRLVLSATHLTVPVPGKQGVTMQLRKVQPTMAGPRGLQGLSDKCNEIAAAVMGKTIKSDENAEAVFQGKGGTETQMLNYRGGNPSLPGGIGNTGPTHVAELVAYTGGQQTNPSAAVGHLGQQNMPTPWQDTASKYGRMDPDERKDRSRELGINQFVAPEVGEAFATHSVQEGPNRPGLDYTRERARDPYWIAMKETFLAAKVKLGQMRSEEAEDALREYARQFQHYVDGPWSWHFAGVVAQTGGDWVTLENYNRDPDLKKAFLEAALRAEQTHRAEFEEYKKALGHEGRSMKEIAAEEPSFAAWAVQELNKDLLAAAQNAIIQVPDAASLWYFQMYGAKKGQTFHEAMAKTGDFTNPLTIRWRDQVTAGFVNSRKDDLDAKAGALRTRHRGGDARLFLDAQLPGILTKGKADIDQAKSKPEVTEIYKHAIDRMDRLDGLLVSLEDSDDLPTRTSPAIPGSRHRSL